MISTVPVYVIEAGEPREPTRFKVGGLNVLYANDRIRLLYPPITLEQWVEENWSAIVYSSGAPW